MKPTDISRQTITAIAQGTASPVRGPELTREVIYLVLINGTWYTDWTSTSKLAFITNLFGTYLVPTVYTFQADRTDMVNHLQALNPEYTIKVRKGPRS